MLDEMSSFSLSDATLGEIRAGMAAQLNATPVVSDADVAVRMIAVDGPPDAPPVRVLAYRPTGAHGTLPALLHIHGGGFVIGAPEMADPENRRLATTLNCAVYSVDYRLAPETRFPGALDDCYATLSYLNAHADALQIDPDRVGVLGESAGGGLAASLALLTRDRGEFPLAFQHLIFPMLDDRTCTHADPHPYAGEYVWTHANNVFGWSAWLGDAPGRADVSPYAAAARASDVAGLPPTFISVGALDLFLEENLEYARRLMRAGVPLELHVYPGAFHAFQLAPNARVTQVALRDSIESLRLAFRPSTAR